MNIEDVFELVDDGKNTEAQALMRTLSEKARSQPDEIKQEADCSVVFKRRGKIVVQDEDGKEESFYITGGLLEVQPHIVTVLADTALRSDQLDEAAALAAQQDAEEALKGASEETDVARAQAELAEARARYRAAQKLKGNR